MSNFKDPLDAIIAKHEAAAKGEAVEKTDETVVPQVPVPPVPDQIILPTGEPIPTPETKAPIEIDYGDDDQDAEIAAEEAERDAMRQAAVEEAAAKRAEEKKTIMPPDSHDPNVMADFANYQTEKVAVVTTMVNKVIAKYAQLEMCRIKNVVVKDDGHVDYLINPDALLKEKAKYKKMLIDWFTSMCLLFVLHFIIILTIQLNNTLVGAIGDASSTGDIAKQFLDNALNNVYFTKGMGNAICYLLLEALTFGFLIAYIKRMITIAFLIIIAPLVTITYSIDRMGDGSSQALNTWFKEFAYNILIQPFHCIAFLALCSTAVDLGKDADLGSATLAICLLAFLAKSAEDIVKRIFGFQAQSMASPVAAAALGYTLAQNTAKFTQKLRSSANGKAPKIPQDNNENGGASTTTPSRASQNNIQVANSNQQNANNNIANANNTANAINTNNTNNTSQTTANMPNPQIKQRKLTGQGIGGKAIRGFARGVLNANKYALTMGTGLALGASQGDLGKTLAGTSFGLEIGQGWASHTAGHISGSHYKTNTAKAFNNYKAKTGMSDEEISKRAMSLLKGDVEPENDNDKELKSAVIDMTNYYRAEGSDEEESYKKTNQVLKDITSGAQGEETGVYRLTGGRIKEKYYKQQAKSYRKKSLDTVNYTQAERDEFKRKSEEAKQFIKDKYAREDFVKRDNNNIN